MGSATPRAAAAAVGVAGLVLSLGACSSSTSPTSSTSSRSPTAGATTAAGARTGGPDDPPSLASSPPAPLDGVSATDAPYPHATVTDPLQAATAGLRTWARPDRSYTAWWAALAPLLSAAALQAYAGTDTSELPSLQITGPATMRPAAAGSAQIVARVVVPTSRGRFGVDLTRTDPTAGWLVSRFVLPAGAGTK